MEVIKLEVGDLIWDSCCKELGIAVDVTESKVKICWLNNFMLWEDRAGIVYDKHNGLPSLYYMPF